MYDIMVSIFHINELGIYSVGDIMHDIDGISISDVNYDKVCLNCIHWRVNVQLKGSAEGVICSKGMGHTNPNDTCSLFSPNPSVDNQDLNRYFDKQDKYDVWRL